MKRIVTSLFFLLTLVLPAAAHAQYTHSLGSGSSTLTCTNTGGSIGSAPTSVGTAGTAGEILYFNGVLYFCSVTGAAGAATWNKLNMTAV